MNERLRRFLAPYASLKLTVVLLALATFLVFAGTVAQIDKGIWTVVDEYFRCAFAWVEFRIFFPRAWDIPGGIWFPGGWLIGGLLLLNVISAHLLRFKSKATGSRLLGGSLVIAAGAVLVGMIIAGVFDQDIAATEEAAFWRVLLRLAKGGGAALVLMIGCMMVFGRRAGIVLLHSGIILMLISEFVTGTFAVEGRMRIEAGESLNYVEHMRSFELAITDRSQADADKVSVIPFARLLKGPVSGDDLPVDVEVVLSMRTSRIMEGAPMGGTNPATTGVGLIAYASEKQEAAGTDTNQTIDIPAAYVRLSSPGGGPDLGTYLVSPWFVDTVYEQQPLQIGDNRYDIELRFERSYKPYSIELLEFRHDTYVGTDTPKNFSSRVRLFDGQKQVDREVTIWMNNPLRYAGETFYQSSYEPGRDLTVLQVVRNRGWMIPYLSCMIVGAGMSLHMGGQLIGFLRRRRGS
ncbi:MAG: cytochrome c biogenesis protein ResB [Planctomycetota bacterium]|jgi:hypothetical protein